MDEKNINQLLRQLGLSVQEMVIFKELLKRGALTVLQISRVSGVARTKVYRVLEVMGEKGLIEEVLEENKKLYQAVNTEGLERLVVFKEQQTKSLRSLFDLAKKDLAGFGVSAQADTKVVFYRGKSGIQQMIWNELSAKGEVLGYSHRVFEEAVGKAFAKKIYEEFLLREIGFREIYSDSYLESFKDGALPHHLKTGHRKETKSRYISKKTLDISSQLDIYNDVVAYYNFFDGEVFGVEIHNKNIAKMQRQLFEIVWKQAKEVKY